MSTAIISTSPAAADADAISVAGSTGTTTARDSGLSVGGTNNKNNLGGEFYASGDNSNITVNAAAGVEALAEKFSETLAKINDTATANSKDTTDLVSDALDKVTQLSEAKQTEGISTLAKIVLWGIGLIVAGLVLSRWKK